MSFGSKWITPNFHFGGRSGGYWQHRTPLERAWIREEMAMKMESKF